jgi:hypothetical protein
VPGAADVEALVPLIVQHGGALIGGYVRDAVIRGQPFVDADIWFKDVASADAFLTALFANRAIRRTGDYPCGRPGCPDGFVPLKTEVWYPYDHMPLVIYKSPGRPLTLDLIVSPTFPVNDLDVNQVSYTGTLHCHSATPNIYDEIKAGRATVLPTYPAYVEGLIAKHKSATILNVMVYHRLRHMRDKGFTIHGTAELDALVKAQAAYWATTASIPTRIDSELKEAVPVLAAAVVPAVAEPSAQCAQLVATLGVAELEALQIQVAALLATKRAPPCESLKPCVCPL